jgi:hypothetical protein
VTALCVIPMDLEYGLLVGGLILGGFVFFFILCKVGERIIMRSELNNSTSEQNNSTLEQNNRTTEHNNRPTEYITTLTPHYNYAAEIME